MDQEYKPVHQKVREWISAAGISQKSIAIDMGISESRLSYMLSGRRRMTADDFILICKVAHISPKQFFE